MNAITNFALKDEPADSQSWERYEKSIDYEVASEIINMMISSYSANLWNEKHTSNPDAERIQQIRAKIFSLRDEQRNLRANNYANVESVINKYGPIVKANYDAQS
jgi:hypothetical protein